MAKRQRSFKLPRKRWEEWSDAVRGKVPAYTKPGFTLSSNLYDELLASLEHEAKDVGLAKMAPGRRHFVSLHRLIEAMEWDGLAVGILYNQPELVDHARTAAKSCKLPKTVKLLANASKQLPPRSLWKSRGRKFDDWFADERRSQRLDQVERDWENCELCQSGSLKPCMQLVLRDPDAFFEAGDSDV